jgi:hypothetical protein
MRAEKLLIKAATAITIEGSRTSMETRLRNPHVPYLFPRCNRKIPTLMTTFLIGK